MKLDVAALLVEALEDPRVAEVLERIAARGAARALAAREAAQLISTAQVRERLGGLSADAWKKRLKRHPELRTAQRKMGKSTLWDWPKLQELLEPGNEG